MATSLQKIRNSLFREIPADPDSRFEERFFGSALWVGILFSAVFASVFVRQLPSLSLSMMQQSFGPQIDPSSSIYPVLVDQINPSKPVPGQMRAYSDVTSGGRGGITAEAGFHTMSADDTLFVSLSGGGGEGGSSAPAGSESSGGASDFSDPDAPGQTGLERRQASGQGGEESTGARPGQPGNGETLPMRIPSNYRFRDDFALRWDSSPSISIPTQELAGYKYFRDMMRQIRSNFAPPGLNLAWRDQAGVVVSQPIKPQIVKVLFLLDREGNVRDVRIVASMGQLPVDEACIRVLRNQNFGTPPPEVFRNGNIFGINFLFPNVYR